MHCARTRTRARRTLKTQKSHGTTHCTPNRRCACTVRSAIGQRLSRAKSAYTACTESDHVRITHPSLCIQIQSGGQPEFVCGAARWREDFWDGAGILWYQQSDYFPSAAIREILRALRDLSEHGGAPGRTHQSRPTSCGECIKCSQMAEN